MVTIILALAHALLVIAVTPAILIGTAIALGFIGAAPSILDYGRVILFLVSLVAMIIFSLLVVIDIAKNRYRDQKLILIMLGFYGLDFILSLPQVFKDFDIIFFIEVYVLGPALLCGVWAGYRKFSQLKSNSPVSTPLTQSSIQ